MNSRPDCSRLPSEVAPAAIDTLATLPVFLTLTGKRAVVAGGTAAAAWKAELLAAAGASVAVYAAQPAEEMIAICARGSAAGRLELRQEPWSARSLTGAVMAICDATDDAEAATFVEACRSAGAAWNVIDRPEYCQFQFGSIVNRSPVVIGISTGGAAPILGQAIRRRIEMLLPPQLAAWGDLARRLRGRVMAELGAGAARRRFWERLAERAFREARMPADEETAFSELRQAPATGGRVTLVGAGPGDAGYLTIDAMRALQAADVILFDDLVSSDVLELARREAKRIQVGKRGWRPSCRQEDITGRMIALARRGRHVVRLKSGDPAIFGRAGEELAALESAGIPATVVPGVTAASAMAARLGLSLTRRDRSHGVRIVTAHRKDGSVPSVAFDPDETTMLYMGGKGAAGIASRAIADGQPPSTPVAAIRSISCPDEKVWAGSLGDLAGGGLPDGTGPVLIGVGAVFGAVAMEAPARLPVEAKSVPADGHVAGNLARSA